MDRASVYTAIGTTQTQVLRQVAKVSAMDCPSGSAPIEELRVSGIGRVTVPPCRSLSSLGLETGAGLFAIGLTAIVSVLVFASTSVTEACQCQ